MERSWDFKRLIEDSGDPRWGLLRPYEVTALLATAVERFDPSSGLALLEFVAQLSDRGCGKLAAPFMSDLLLKAVREAASPEERARARRFISARVVPAILRSVSSSEARERCVLEEDPERLAR